MSIPEPKQWTITIMLSSEEELPNHAQMSQIIIDALWDAGYPVSMMYHDVWDTPLIADPEFASLLIERGRYDLG
jgi:hypothetical protein